MERLWHRLLSILNSRASWAMSASGCLTLAKNLPFPENVEVAVSCLAKLLTEDAFLNPSPVLVLTIGLLLNLVRRREHMACVTFHKSSTKVQGPGLCCAQVGVAGGLVAPPPGTTLPQYIPGQADAGQIPPGRIVQVTDAGGHCASCMIVGSASKKHPGKPVLKFVRGGPACPTAGTGCCAL